MTAWITEEFDEKRLLFRFEDLDKLEEIRRVGQFHFTIMWEKGSEWCWVSETDIVIVIYAISCLYTLTIN